MALVDLPLGPNYVLSTGTSGVSSKAVTLPQTVMAGNYIIVAGACWRASSPAPVVITDDQGSSWTSIDSGTISWSSGLSTCFLAYAKAANNATYVITATPSGSSSFISFGAMEVINVHPSVPLDATGTATTGTGTALSFSVTAGANNVYAFAVATKSATADATAWVDNQSGQLSFLNDLSNLNAPWALGAIRVPTAGSQTFGWTITNSQTWRVIGVTLAADLSDDVFLGDAAITLADTTLASAGTFLESGGPGLGQAVTTRRYHRMSFGG